MKRIHHFLPSAIAMLLAMASLTMFAFASETEYAQSQKFEDGFYMVVTIEHDQPQEDISYFASRSTTGGTKNILITMVRVGGVLGTRETPDNHEGLPGSACPHPRCRMAAPLPGAHPAARAASRLPYCVILHVRTPFLF